MADKRLLRTASTPWPAYSTAILTAVARLVRNGERVSKRRVITLSDGIRERSETAIEGTSTVFGFGTGL